MLNPGDKVKDKVTGLTGIITAITSYLQGCRRVHVTPDKLKDDGTPHDTFAFDEPQCELIKAQVIPWEGLSKPDKKRPGGANYICANKPLLGKK